MRLGDCRCDFLANCIADDLVELFIVEGASTLGFANVPWFFKLADAVGDC